MLRKICPNYIPAEPQSLLKMMKFHTQSFLREALQRENERKLGGRGGAGVCVGGAQVCVGGAQSLCGRGKVCVGGALH